MKTLNPAHTENKGSAQHPSTEAQQAACAPQGLDVRTEYLPQKNGSAIITVQPHKVQSSINTNCFSSAFTNSK